MCSTLFLSLALLANIDSKNLVYLKSVKFNNFWNKFLVAQAGSSSHDVCGIYVDTFSIIYNETSTSLTQAFQNANYSLHLVNVNIPREDYLDQLNMIVLSWIDENQLVLQSALDAAASLTGSASEYISGLIDGSITNPPSPLSCLYDMIIELDTTINSFINSLTSIILLLSDSQLVVGDHRPNTSP